MSIKEKKWFEFKDIIDRNPEKQVWTPIWQFTRSIHQGRSKFAGFADEVFVHRLIAFPLAQKEMATQLKWDDITLGFGNQPDTYSEEYREVDIAHFFRNKCEGLYLGLEQHFDTDPTILHLNQDLIFALKLIRRGDVWVNPYEDETVVAKLEYKKDMYPEALLIRTDYLRDYLCARKMGAILFTYHERFSIEEHNPKYWDADQSLNDSYRLSNYIRSYHEGTLLEFGGKVRVLNITRDNTDYSEDIPLIDATSQEDNKVDSYDKGAQGREVFGIKGRLWINKWISPFDKSLRVKSEDQKSNSYFFTDVSDEKICGSDLDAQEGWLWFKPDLIGEILKREKSSLTWYTKDTGEIAFHKAASILFGVNKVGLINLLCEDVCYLTEFHRNILVGFNVPPEGGVSKELLQTQKDGRPANTRSAEWLLNDALKYLDSACEDCLNKHILREHQDLLPLMKKIHRFRAITPSGLYDLANDLNKIFVERLDIDVLRKLSANNSKDKLGSIKELAKYIDSRGQDGRKYTQFIAGCYELRHGATHLMSGSITEAYELAGLKEDQSSLLNGEVLIFNVARTIGFLSNCVRGKFGESDE